MPRASSRWKKSEDQIMGLWFQDCIEFGHGSTLSIKIKDVLYHGRSRFQEIASSRRKKWVGSW
jgi:spermidine synthase